MKNRILLIGVALLSTVTASSALAQQVGIRSDNTAYGTTAAEFLLLHPTARGSALGNGFAALATDISAIYYNPAGLSQLDRPGIAASNMTYVADTRYNWFAFAVPFSGGSRAIGLSATSFGFGDQRVYTDDDPDGESGETYGVNEVAIGLTLAQRFSDRFSAGFTGKFINDQLADVSGTAFAVDFGTNFHANVGGRPLRAGFVIQNLGTTIQHDGQGLDGGIFRGPPQGVDSVAQEPAAARLRTKNWGLPVMFRVSLAYDLFATSASRFSLMGEFNQPNNTDPGYNVGGEYNLGLGSSGFSIAGRVGYTSAPDNNLDPVGDGTATPAAGFSTAADQDGKEGFSLGGGLKYSRRGFGVGFDYAYRHLGLLGSVNMITVGINW